MKYIIEFNDGNKIKINSGKTLEELLYEQKQYDIMWFNKKCINTKDIKEIKEN